jgi:hypothetical protein
VFPKRDDTLQFLYRQLINRPFEVHGTLTLSPNNHRKYRVHTNAASDDTLQPTGAGAVRPAESLQQTNPSDGCSLRWTIRFGLSRNGCAERLDR